MTPEQIKFTDGAAYERYMGAWSQLAGESFLDWLGPPRGWRWLDVGCGNGAFTQLIVDRCHPRSVHGVDPSAAQLEYARTRPAARVAEFQQGDAMSLPFAGDQFDVAIMPLVIFFVPQPAVGVAEMARVVRAGGQIAAYAWDMPGGGFPYDILLTDLRAMGVAVPSPPNPDASSLDNLRALWSAAGLEAIDTQAIEVERTFNDFEDYWTTILGAPSVGAVLAAMSPDDREQLRSRLRVRLPANRDGHIVCGAVANAIKGSVRS